ncbi:MAG: thioredoxin domain-containing protein [Elusimicrobia bacterium]|nr:thioredoxin domain-containing protein [Elusimicrobiota bacterium]
MPTTRASRNLLAGILLLSLPATAVVVGRHTQTPWIAQAPQYRQKGDAEAKITLVEFSDFECPGCASATPLVKQLLATYHPNVRLVFKYFAWDFHKHAKSAAVAAECAGRQGKFWPMHDMLYLRQGSWSVAPDARIFFRAYAKEIGLNFLAFEACLNDAAALAAVDQDIQEARDHWLNSTPTFFINGKRFSSSMQLRTLGSREIDRLLKKQK